LRFGYADRSHNIKRLSVILLFTALLSAGCSTLKPAEQRPLIGVAFLVHGGFDEYSDAALWDSTLQIFAYDPNSFVYQKVIWNSEAWPLILRVGNAPKERGKYRFEHALIGGRDPAMDLSRRQLADMQAALVAAESDLGVRFVVDYVNWIGDIPHLAHPRSLYNPAVANGTPVTYCGPSGADDGEWRGCDPQRYDTDGTIDRMLSAGVSRILVIDLTTSGVRFFKSNDVIRQSRAIVDAHNALRGTAVTLDWLNDPTDLMRASYPDAPANWTATLGEPQHDPKIPLDRRPNPVAADPRFAMLHAEGIERRMNPSVPAKATGVMLINHATRPHNQLFDPKIDDTLILNANIRDLLLERHPGLRAENIVGAWMGVEEINPDIKPRPPAFSQEERTRGMRGENLGHAYLYETDHQLPDGEWGYRYWDALDYLKAQGMKHIVIAFPQITVDSVLNLVEVPNQIAKEIGYKTWLYHATQDFATYPTEGNPFADYWGIWVERECAVPEQPDVTTQCCFEMGGCGDQRPYPPPRQTAFDEARDDLDPSLAYDVSEYGHLGYDPAAGQPDPDRPVQSQYAGTWALWSAPNDDPRVGQLLARHVIDFLQAENTQ